MSPKNSKKKSYIDTLGNDNRIKRGVDILNTQSLILFNFKFFLSGADYGQSFEEWQNDGILSDLNIKLQEFSCSSVEELKRSKRLALYDHYPFDSAFKEPLAFKGLDVKWARLRLTGRRRLIGVFVSDTLDDCNVFYVVFLDKNHQFYPVEKD